MTANRKRKDNFMPDDRQIATCGRSVITGSLPRWRVSSVSLWCRGKKVLAANLWHGACLSDWQ